MVGYSKKNRENYPKKNAFHTKKKKSQGKIEPWVSANGTF